MSDAICRIEKLANGYTVEVCDPAVMASNKKSKSAYKDPWKEYAFKNVKEVSSFLAKVLPTLSPEKDETGEAFAEACSTAED